MSNKLRIAFMGTPDFVVPVFQALHNSGHDLVCVYTQPPREKGRKKQIEKTPVHAAAEDIGVEVRHPINFKDVDDVQEFEDLHLDVAIVAAFGMLLPQNILDAPKYGCLNIHPSLLPRWRGPSPVQYAIWKGDRETGVSLMSLEKGMDTGPIVAQEQCIIDTDTNFLNLNKILWDKGIKLLIDCLDGLSETGELKTTPQPEEGVTYCKLFTKEQGKIDWTSTAWEIDCQIRGLNPWPGTFCFIADGKRLKVLNAYVLNETTDKKAGMILEQGKIACGEGSVLQLVQIQPENKKSMDIQAALNGGYLVAGDFLS